MARRGRLMLTTAAAFGGPNLFWSRPNSFWAWPILGLAQFRVSTPKSRVPAQVRPVTVRLVSDGCPDSACHVSCLFVSFHRLFSSLCF